MSVLLADFGTRSLILSFRRLNSFLSPTEAAGAELTSFQSPLMGDGQQLPQPAGFDTAFFGLPLGASMTEEW